MAASLLPQELLEQADPQACRSWRETSRPVPAADEPASAQWPH